MADPSTRDTLLVEFDDTDRRLRVWHGARMIGEMRPDLSATPAEESDARWTGWLSTTAVVELVGTYNGAAILGINPMKNP